MILGRLPEIVFLICAGAGLIAILRTRPLSAHGRAAIALLIICVLTPTLAWLLSQSSPAWANRYLAVAVPPFLLLATGGLAYARRLGVFGLVLVVIMWAQDTSPVEKSNVRAIAHTIGPSLAPGDLVISTQPETIPLLHYYLPEGLRYATLTGEETDFGVWDWRDGVERLEATSAESGPGAADRLAGARHPRRAGRADRVDAQPLARALDEADPDPLEGVVAGALQRPDHADHVDSADQLHAAAAEPGAGDGAT